MPTCFCGREVLAVDATRDLTGEPFCSTSCRQVAALRGIEVALDRGTEVLLDVGAVLARIARATEALAGGLTGWDPDDDGMSR